MAAVQERQAAYRDEVLEIEPRGIEHVPERDKHGSPVRAFTLWFAANLCMATWVVGALGAIFGLGLYESLAAIVVGNLLGMVCLGAVSAMGPRSSVPQMVLTRASFGYVGTFVPAFFNWVACIGWFAVNTILGVLALQQLLHVPYIISVALMVVGQVALAVYGHNVIHSYEKWMTYVLGALFLVATALTLGRLGGLHGHALALGGFHPAGFATLVAAALGYALGWTPYGADYSRYLPTATSPGRIFNLTFLAGFVSAVWIEALGALIAAMALTASANPVTQLTGIMGLFAGPMLIAIILGTGTSNALNIYSGALSALVLDVPLKRWVSAVVIGALGTILLLLAGTNPLQLEGEFQSYLLLLAYWIAPWLAIVIGDYYLLHRGRYDTAALYRRNGVRWAGLGAYVAGILVSVPFMSQQLFTGPIAKTYLQGADLSYYVGFIVAGALYLAFARARSSEVTPAARRVEVGAAS
jgi:NCS1 family nucleobase:cation symporter-1